MKVKREIYMNGTSKKDKNYYYRITTKNNDILADNITLPESVKMIKELNLLDKNDGVYEKDFYQLERIWY